MSNQPKHLYEFGPFCLDPKRPRLTRDGEIVSLTPKALEILLVLVRSGGTLVAKEDLMKSVWPDTFVEEGNLSVHIFALRKALGENADGEVYIETIPRAGYRFTTTIREVEPNTDALIVEKYSWSELRVEEKEAAATIAETTFEKPTALLAAPTGLLRRKVMWTVAVVALLLVGAAAISYQLSSQNRTIGGSATRVRSIAVLPFRTIGTTADDEHLGLGMADTLITRLSTLRQIVVRPTGAILKYESNVEDPIVSGRALKVDGVLEGTIQRSDQRVRINVRLIKVQDGSSMWAGKFDEELNDILAVQDSISEQVARALLVNISSEDKNRLTKRYTENVTAYNLYLKGRHFWNMRTPDGLHRSIDYFNQAIAVDTNYALAYAGLADSYALLSGYGILSPAEGFSKARISALQALQMDDQLAEAHTSLAFVSVGYDKDWATAEREYKRATELNSNYVTAHHWFAEFLSAQGRHDEAIAEIRRALEIDPVSPIVNSDAGEILCFARRNDEAIAQLKNTLELEPNFIQAHRFLAIAYLQKGMYQESIAELERASENSNRNPVILALLAHTYAASGNKRQAEKLLEELKALSTKQYVSPHEFGVIYIGLGDHDRAFEYLRRAVEQRTGTLAFIKVNPVYDKLRSDPRFAELLRQLNVS